MLLHHEESELNSQFKQVGKDGAEGWSYLDKLKPLHNFPI